MLRVCVCVFQADRQKMPDPSGVEPLPVPESLGNDCLAVKVAKTLALSLGLVVVLQAQKQHADNKDISAQGGGRDAQDTTTPPTPDDHHRRHRTHAQAQAQTTTD